MREDRCGGPEWNAGVGEGEGSTSRPGDHSTGDAQQGEEASLILAMIDYEGLFQPIDMAKMYQMGGLEGGRDAEDDLLALPRAKSASSVPANVESESSEDDMALVPFASWERSLSATSGRRSAGAWPGGRNQTLTCLQIVKPTRRLIFEECDEEEEGEVDGERGRRGPCLVRERGRQAVDCSHRRLKGRGNN